MLDYGRWRRPEARIRVYFVVLVSTYFIVSLGTAAIEGWSVLDALYFGMATMTTLGYGDIHPVTLPGKILVTFLSPIGIVLVFGIGFLMLQSRLQRSMGRREETVIDPKLEGHYIVCGFGKVGQVVARTLRRMGKDVCIIERDTSKEVALREDKFSYVFGNAMDRRSLERARIDTAAKVVTTFENDADNVYVVLEVRDVRSDIKIIATSSNADTARKATLAGAERVVSPAALAGDLLAKSALNPDVIDFLSELSEASSSKLSISQVAVQEGAWIAGKTLRNIGSMYPGVRIVITKHHEHTNIAPAGDLVVQPGMVLLVVGSAEEVDSMQGVTPPASKGAVE